MLWKLKEDEKIMKLKHLSSNEWIILLTKLHIIIEEKYGRKILDRPQRGF